MSLEIWVPGTADVGDRQVVLDERKVVDRCRICKEFVRYEGEPARAMDLHAARCVRRHEEEIREKREREHPSIMRPWDTEFARWMRVNKDDVLRGRLKP